MKNFIHPREVKIIVIVGFIVFFNSLFNGFVWDDQTQILTNPFVHSLQFIPNFFSNRVVYAGQEILFNHYFRPFYFLNISLLYTFLGGSAFVFHLQQLLIHITNTVLIFLIFSRFFKKNLSLLVSILFLVHPMNVEAVSYISSNVTTLSVMFGLLSFYFITQEKTGKKEIILSTIFLVSSFLFKESGLLFVPLILLYGYIFVRKNIKNIFMSCGASLLLYFLLRLFSPAVVFKKLSYMYLMNTSLSERILYIPKIIYFYLSTFLFPYDLIIFQTWRVINLNFSDFYFPLIIVVIFILVVVLAISKIKKERDIFMFFLFWFLLGMAINLQIIPLDATVADRWFYFPLAGLLGMIAVGLQKFENKKYFFGIFVVLIILFSIRTIVRNSDWANNLTLYSHDAKKSGDFEILNSLGVELVKAERNNEAIYVLKQSIEKYPYNLNYTNLAVAYDNLGERREAQYYYEKATSAASLYQGIGFSPDGEVFENLGTFYLKYSDNSMTLKFAQNSVVKFPRSAKLRMILAISEYRHGLKSHALEDARKAYELESTDFYLQYLEKMEKGLPAEVN